MSFTTEKIKTILMLMGHTGLKRTAKRKNSTLIHREFLSDTAEIVVQTNEYDTQFIEMRATPLTLATQVLAPLQVISLADFTTELSRVNANELLIHTKNCRAIYNIPIVEATVEPSQNYIIFNYTNTPVVVNTHYREAIALTEFQITTQTMSVANADYDGKVKGSFVIPVGSYVHHWNSDYQQLVAISLDTTSGACTYDPESDTYTFNPDIAADLDMTLIDNKDKINYELSFLKTARKYDIISTCN